MYDWGTEVMGVILCFLIGRTHKHFGQYATSLSNRSHIPPINSTDFLLPSACQGDSALLGEHREEKVKTENSVIDTSMSADAMNLREKARGVILKLQKAQYGMFNLHDV